MGTIKIILYDDYDSIRDSVGMLLRSVPGYTVAASFSNCLRVIENIQEIKPDVVIMDIDIPGINGIEAVRVISKNFPAVQILMLTVFDDDEKIFAAIKAGAGGYILKNSGAKNLINAIAEVYDGGAPFSPGIARRVLLQFQQLETDSVKEDYHLTNREKDVLALLVEGLSYKMIGAKLNIAYDTVRSHMKKIYEKLHVSSMTEAVAKAINRKLF